MLAVVDVAENPLTEIATHVLPATGQLERADITLAELTALRSGLQATAADRRAGRRPPAGVVDVRRAEPRRWVTRRRAASTPTTSRDEDYLRGVLAHSPLDADDVFAAGPRGIDTPVEHGWVHAELLADGRWSIAPAPLLERLAAYADPAPGRVRARAAARDGVEQLDRVRRGARPGPSCA